jgi:response regulator RpfG family c-di-GMP phosphodiesterase
MPMGSTQGSRQWRCLVIEDDQEMSGFVAFIVESKFQGVATCASTIKQALECLKSQRAQIDLIICDYRLPDGTGGDVFRYLIENNIQIPYILCSSDAPTEHPEFKLGPLAGFAEKPIFHDPLCAAIEEFLKRRNFAAPQVPDLPQSETNYYVRVHARLLRLVNTLPCDIYVRLNDTKFVQVYHQQDVFADPDLDKYRAKNIEYLYIALSDCKFLFDRLIVNLSNTAAIKTVTSEPQFNPFEVSLDIEECIHDLGSRLGFTPELQILTKANLKVTLQLIAKNPSLSALLASVHTEKASYISSHSVSLAVLSCWMANRVGWQSEQTFLKLSLAAFLHDITLNDQTLARVGHESELGKSEEKYTERQIEAWKSHPLAAAEIAAQFEEIPPDSDLIIAQHHERPHGEVGPRHLNHTRIAPLSALFIIAHDLVGFLLTRGREVGISDFKASYSEVYNVGYFKKIIQAL